MPSDSSSTAATSAWLTRQKLTIAVEIMSVASVTSLIIAAIILQIEFAAIDIPFLSIATVQDILGAGLTLLVRFAIAFTICGMIPFGTMLLMIYSPTSRQVRLMAMILLLFSVFSWFLPDTYQGGLEIMQRIDSVARQVLWIDRWALLILGLTMLGLSWSPKLQTAMVPAIVFKLLDRRNATRVLVTVIALGTIASVGTTAFLAFIDLRRGIGVVENITLPAPAQRCRAAALIWLGSDRAIVRCRGAYFVVKDLGGGTVLLRAELAPNGNVFMKL